MCCGGTRKCESGSQCERWDWRWLVPEPIEENENVPGSTIFKNLVEPGTKTGGWCPKNHQLAGKWWILGQTAVQPDEEWDAEAAGAMTWHKDPARQQRRHGPIAPVAKKAPATQRVTRAFQATSNWKLAASPAGTGETGLARIYADG